MEEAQRFKPGDLIIYQNGDKYEIGKIKRITEDGAFVWYHEGPTAAKTPFQYMHRMVNSYAIKKTTLGGRDAGSWLHDESINERLIDDGK